MSWFTSLVELSISVFSIVVVLMLPPSCLAQETSTTVPTPSPHGDDYNNPNHGFVNDPDGSAGPTAYILFIVVAILVIMCCCVLCFVFVRRHRMEQASLATRQTTLERHRARLQSERASVPTTPTPVDPTVRKEQILTKFYFQTVLPDNSRTAFESGTVQSGKQEGVKPPPPFNEDEENLAVGECPSSPGILSKIFPFLGKKASLVDDCCICLNGYRPGETICAPITDKCNHLFHEECVMEWLRDHDLCPLCRVNLME
eukprot:scaffold340_cov96-Cylindrotheca_fusiformis.AAC.2